MKNLNQKLIMHLSVCALLLFTGIKTEAQSVEFGVRLMPTFSSVKVKTSSGGTIQGQYTIGFGFGGILGFNFTEFVGAQGEVIYSSISQKYKEQDVEHNLKLRYINIPLLLSLNTGKSKKLNGNFVVGPQIGISVGSSVKTTGGDGTNNTQAILSVKKGDLGFAYGVGLDFGLNAANTARLGFGFRGVYGLIDISKDNNNNSTNSYYILDKTNLKTYSAYLGISFIF